MSREYGTGAAPDGNQDALLDMEIKEALRKKKARKIADEMYEAGEAAYQAAMHPDGRWVNLDQYLDGEYIPSSPDIGAPRDDNTQFLYRAKWHTMIGLTTAGKTFWALWQAKHVLENDGHVIYIHFEEANPAETLARLRHMGVDKEVLRKQFHWPETRPWTRGEMEQEIERLTDYPTLAVLDGINAACGDHGWRVSEAESVGAYRAMFVHPLTAIGCTVLSLGHPVKAPNRQTESYSYGAAGWLNDVDGVSYRLTASKDHPITKGQTGFSNLYSVKDRPGSIQEKGIHQDSGDMPWYYQGSFHIDDTGTAQLLKVTAPRTENGSREDKYDVLAEKVRGFLWEQTDKTWKSQNDLDTKLRAAGITFPRSDLVVTLQRLATRGLIDWPEVEDKKPRPGKLKISRHPDASF